MTGDTWGKDNIVSINCIPADTPRSFPTQFPFPDPEVVAEQVDKLFKQKVCFEVCYTDKAKKKRRRNQVIVMEDGSVFLEGISRGILNDRTKIPTRKKLWNASVFQMCNQERNQRDLIFHQFQWPTGGFCPSCPHNSGLCRLGGLSPWKAHSCQKTQQGSHWTIVMTVDRALWLPRVQESWRKSVVSLLFYYISMNSVVIFIPDIGDSCSFFFSWLV